MNADLRYEGRDFYKFEDHTYRWVDLKRFALSGSGDDQSVLAAMLGHVRYRDHYMSADSQDIDCGPLHGPYRLEAITPDAYIPVTADQAFAMVAEFANLLGGAPSKVRAEISEGLDPVIRAATNRFQLRSLPDEARHEFGWILWEFRELLIINADGLQVALVVMAID